MRIRTFSAWNNRLPGYLEVAFVCGGTKINGDFVHSFVLTDIATGWTGCLPCLIEAVRSFLTTSNELVEDSHLSFALWIAITIRFS
ncbi:hypothetical protein BG57_23535 [Caballeronia grimmiae]|uniref:Uncharacterized protein n=1 Tax=Caballeronia grimmiae TaxID=1071679 RepID=A0A069NI12_9BURK|nr:hypothetical protein BG57_23535 [Caballeronia grimmiae]